MKTTLRKALALLLAVALLLSLCACAKKPQTESGDPKKSPDKVNLPTLPTKADKKAPEGQPEENASQGGMSNHTSGNETVDTQPVQSGFSREAEASLEWLRDRLSNDNVWCGISRLCRRPV